MGLLNKYSLGHCGLSAASRHKFAFTSRHYALLTAAYWHYSTLLNSFFVFLKKIFVSRSKLIFKVPTTTWGVPPGHILTNLIINWLLDVDAYRKWGKSPILWTVNGWRLPKLTIRYNFNKTKKSISLDSRFVDLESNRVLCHLNAGIIRTPPYPKTCLHSPTLNSPPSQWEDLGTRLAALGL